MKRTRNRWTVLVLLGALATPTMFSTTATGTPNYTAAIYAAQASELLQEVRSLAAKVSHNTDRLAVSMGSNQLHWMSHTSYLNQAKDGINEIGERLETLKELRHSVHPWQQQAIDRIHASSLSAARHTDSALRYLNDNQSWLLAPSYKDDVSAIQAHTEDVRNTANDFLNYAETKERLGTLEQRLAL